MVLREQFQNVAGDLEVLVRAEQECVVLSVVKASSESVYSLDGARHADDRQLPG